MSKTNELLNDVLLKITNSLSEASGEKTHVAAIVAEIINENVKMKDTLEYIANSGISGSNYRSHSSLVQLAAKTIKEVNK